MEMDGLIQMRIGQQEQIAMVLTHSLTMQLNGVMKIMMDMVLMKLEIMQTNVRMKQELQQ